MWNCTIGYKEMCEEESNMEENNKVDKNQKKRFENFCVTEILILAKKYKVK